MLQTSLTWKGWIQDRGTNSVFLQQANGSVVLLSREPLVKEFRSQERLPAFLRVICVPEHQIADLSKVIGVSEQGDVYYWALSRPGQFSIWRISKNREVGDLLYTATGSEIGPGVLSASEEIVVSLRDRVVVISPNLGTVRPLKEYPERWIFSISARGNRILISHLEDGRQGIDLFDLETGYLGRVGDEHNNRIFNTTLKGAFVTEYGEVLAVTGKELYRLNMTTGEVDAASLDIVFEQTGDINIHWPIALDNENRIWISNSLTLAVKVD